MTRHEFAETVDWANETQEGYFLVLTLKSGTIIRGPFIGFPSGFADLVQIALVEAELVTCFVMISEVAAVAIEAE